MRNKKWSADEGVCTPNCLADEMSARQIIWRTSRPHSNITCRADSFSSYRLPRRVLWR